MKKKKYNIFVWIAFISIAFPMLAGFLKTDNKPDLTGIVINNVNPDSLLKKDKSMWFSGEYQALKDDYNNDHWAFKEKFVRMNNQFYFEAFNQIRVNSFVLGTDNYVYSESYIFSAFGDDFIGEERVLTKLQKAKVIQDSLKRKGIDLLLVFAPGKGEHCIEHIDNKYKHNPSRTNYQAFLEHSQKLGINVLDLKGYFQKLKPTSPYPLFPKFGHHWSYYGECIAVDTIIGFIEKLHSCDMPDIAWNKIDVVDSARSRDADVLKSMNLYKNPTQNMQLAYPDILFEQDSSKNRTRVLTISDSYWYGPVYMGVGQNCFAGGQFWYYYNKIIPNPSPTEKIEVWQLDLKESIERNDVIMILYSDGNLPNFSNAFIDDAYELYTNPKSYAARVERNRNIRQFEKQIREKPILLKKSTRKSEELQIPLDSAIKLDAMKLAGISI
jgi:hypothetical protein